MRKTSDYTTHYKDVYVKYAPSLIRFAEKFVAEHYAEDIVQDVFLKLWDHHIFELPEHEIKRILYTSVRNACIDYLRKVTVEQELIDKRDINLKIDELHYLESHEDLFMRKDMVDLLLKTIDELPGRSREIFKMFYIEGIKASEISEQLDISVRTVENHLYRSLSLIRKKSSRLFIYFLPFI